MADALFAIEEIERQLTALTSAVTTHRSRRIPPTLIQPITRTIANVYFGDLRQELEAHQNRTGLVEEIDWVVQSLLQLASSTREKEAYLGHINEFRPFLLEATIDVMKSRASSRLVLSDTERTILNTLAAMLPNTAASYEQSLWDIRQGRRVSWRGTATELREVLREVIDHLAPDEEVMASSGFQLEKDQTKPTQRQKVRFILRARRNSKAAVGVAEASLATVEETVATLARSTYQRGSVSTHTGSTSKEIKNLKRYVDALLGELLEIS
jgi:hypothetical protein